MGLRGIGHRRTLASRYGKVASCYGGRGRSIVSASGRRGMAADEEYWDIFWETVGQDSYWLRRQDVVRVLRDRIDALYGPDSFGGNASEAADTMVRDIFSLETPESDMFFTWYLKQVDAMLRESYGLSARKLIGEMGESAYEESVAEVFRRQEQPGYCARVVAESSGYSLRSSRRRF